MNEPDGKSPAYLTAKLAAAERLRAQAEAEMRQLNAMLGADGWEESKNLHEHAAMAQMNSDQLIAPDVDALAQLLAGVRERTGRDRPPPQRAAPRCLATDEQGGGSIQPMQPPPPRPAATAEYEGGPFDQEAPDVPGAETQMWPGPDMQEPEG